MSKKIKQKYKSYNITSPGENKTPSQILGSLSNISGMRSFGSTYMHGTGEVFLLNASDHSNFWRLKHMIIQIDSFIDVEEYIYPHSYDLFPVREENHTYSRNLFCWKFVMLFVSKKKMKKLNEMIKHKNNEIMTKEFESIYRHRR